MTASVSTQKLAALFRRCFPYSYRNEGTLREVLAAPENRVFPHRVGDDLAAAAVLQRGTLLMLAVDAAYRRQGLGGALLQQAEEAARAAGERKITVGVGAGYLTPGVPTGKSYFGGDESHIPPGLTDEAAQFFAKRGYRHGEDCDIFDMAVELSDLPPLVKPPEKGVHICWARPEERDSLCAAVGAAEPNFEKYYRNPALYAGTGPERVLIALSPEGEALGGLRVSFGVEGEGVGSLGCTAVRPEIQRQGVATRLCIAAVEAMRDAGMRRGFLGFTYSGLERLYGRAGFSPCAYYMMAQKELAG